MKKILFSAASFFVLSLSAQTDTFRKSYIPLEPIQFDNRSSGQIFTQSSNSQLAALGISLLSAYLFHQAGEVKRSALPNSNIDATDDYFVAGVVLAVGVGFEVSYLSKYRKAGKQLKLEQEREKLEREKLERRIMELEKNINKV